MALTLSDDDREFRQRFETFAIAPAEFDHRSHLRLAYTYLVGNDDEAAYSRMREALHAFLEHNDVDPAKYHDTLTRAWILALQHFMIRTGEARDFNAFVAQHPQMLDSQIMLSHYSADRLFSDDARMRFVEPDLDPIPRYKRD